LGLTLALRAARAHAFQLELLRDGTLTEAWIRLGGRELEAPLAKVTT